MSSLEALRSFTLMVLVHAISVFVGSTRQFFALMVPAQANLPHLSSVRQYFAPLTLASRPCR